MAEILKMTKIDIFSGFLGAGKTTLIKKLIKEAYSGEKLVLIENEFGEIGIDGAFLKDAGIEITEMNSGCICCSLVGDFSKALVKVLDEFHPDRIIIEPSGVGKLSDVIKAVRSVETDEAVLNTFTTVADVNKCKMYMKNFGEFYNDQIANASSIVLSHTDIAKGDKVEATVELIRQHNESATIVTTPWDKLDGKDILAAMEKKDTLAQAIEELQEEYKHHHHHGEECDCHDHEHHHHHNHHHHADDVFTSWGRETVKKYSVEDISSVLKELENAEKYGLILRAKGIVEAPNGSWVYFDYVPEEPDVRLGSPSSIGKICVIGANINESAIAELFGL